MARRKRPNDIVGHNFWVVRLRAGRTQRQVADALGMYREAITEVEHGRRRLSLPEAYAAACFLGCSLARLTKGLPNRVS